ncbi:sterol desaturase family protein [Kiloniella sp.]|uniref:sterol desaturase family protein n=1 Tax=Kiloniella sp. TaxID=1938587 RepID=UPI003B017E3E
MEDLTEQLLAYKGVVVFTWIALLFISERLNPAVLADEITDNHTVDANRGLARIFPMRVQKNIGLWICNIILSPLIIIQITIWATENSLDWRPDYMNGWSSLVIDVLIMDFLIYWWHRLNHEIPFLWRFHEVHHLDDTLDTTSALRFHFGEILLSAIARAGIVIILDVSFASIIVFETCVLIATVFHHSNIKFKRNIEKLLGYIFITPGIHWIHHHAIRADTDSNYGTIFSCWDPLFNTRSKNTRKLGMRIGVEGVRDKGFIALLLRPFRLRKN